MDEQQSQKGTPKDNKSTRPLPDAAEKVDHAEKEDRSGERNSGQPDYYIWGLPWPGFVAVTVALLGVLATSIAAGLRWHADTISQARTQEKERARVELSDIRMEPEPHLSFSLIFKNEGPTAALNTSSAWLQGECHYTSSQKCIDWCLQPLRGTKGKGYGSLSSQDEHKEEFFSLLKAGNARKKQRPVYFCGYFAYTDVYCMWRRQFYVVSYDPATDRVGTHVLRNNKEEAEVENCNPRRLY